MSQNIPMKFLDWVDESKLDWNLLAATNPNIIYLIQKYPHKTNSYMFWIHLSKNPYAIPLLEQNPDKIRWNWASANPSAISLLEQNPDKINWFWLSENSNAIPLLEKNLEKINWVWLSKNPNAIPILERNPDKIDWYYLSINPNITTYDYAVMKENHRDLKEELIQRAWHPSRIATWLEAGLDLDDL